MSLSYILLQTIELTKIPLPSTPHSEQWVAWLLLFLAILLLIVMKFHPKLIGNSFKTITSVKDRESIFLKSAKDDSRLQISMGIYVLGILALTLFLLVFDNKSPFRFLTYIHMLAFLIVFFALKHYLNRFLAYVFFNREIFQTCRRHYILLLNVCSVILYPTAILYIYLPASMQVIAYILYAIIALFFGVVFVVKFFYFFFQKPLGAFYILLYLCALEILPLLGLIWVVQKIL